MESRNTKTTRKVICYHCGDLCHEEHVVFDGKDFCCNGCRTVFEILNENGLCNYYDLEKNPGISLKTREFGDKYKFLDNKDIQDKLMQFSGEKISKVTFYIPSIHCSSCIWLLENLYILKESIYHSRVNFVKKEILIDYNPTEISLRNIVELLATIGYEPYISLDAESKKKHQSINRSLLIKIGVAGFSFGNIMLLSFPEYFGFEGIDDLGLQKFITWLNVLLAIPVVFYCSIDYFKSAVAGIRQRYINIDVPIALGVISLFTRSLFEVISHTGPGYFDSLAGLMFFLLIGRWIQSRTYEGLSFERDYKSYFPLAVVRVIKGKEEPIPVRDLTKDDEIIIRNHEIIPADSILLGEHAYIDYSFVTGEADPVSKGKDDFIYAGGRQVGPSIRLKVQKPVSQSYLTQLWNNEVFNKSDSSQLNNLVDRISKYFTGIVLGIAIIAFITWQFIDPDKSWFILTAVLIVACPCALALATPFTLGNTMRVFGQNHLYLKNAHVIEKLTRIKHLVFDKTGTITENRSSKILFKGEHLSTQQFNWIKSLASNSNHPLSRRIVEFENGTDGDFRSVPQDYVELEGHGLKGTVNGHNIIIGSISYIKNTINNLQSLRVNKTDSSSAVHVSIDEEYKGYFQIENKYRKDILPLMQSLNSRYSISLLSGDNEKEKSRLQKILPGGSEMLFHQKPEDKLDHISNIQQKGLNVLMLGDGLNDAGALKKADTGIAVTDDITAFTPASDAILDGNKLFLLNRILNFSRIAKYIIVANFIISFLYNIIGMGFAVSGNLRPIVAAILMPISSITVVAFATFAVNTMAKLKKLI
ncbi:heavy metal translocating P-type ATPase [Bacteroidota bacterium]